MSRRYVSADDIYMKTRMFQIYLTDEMVDPSGKFSNGGTLRSWPLGGSTVSLWNGTSRSVSVSANKLNIL